MYVAGVFGTDPPPALAARIARLRLAQLFPGWTLDYIDGLDALTLAEIWGLLEGQARLQWRT